MTSISTVISSNTIVTVEYSILRFSLVVIIVVINVIVTVNFYSKQLQYKGHNDLHNTVARTVNMTLI